MSKKKHPEHVNHERWLVSYADFITLLFAFFVVLFASSRSDKVKQKKIAVAITTAFTQMAIFDPHSAKPALEASTGAGASSNSTPSPMQLPMATAGDSDTHQSDGIPSTDSASELESPDILRSRVQALIQQQIATGSLQPGDISIRRTAEGLTLSLQEGGFFDSGSATILPAALPALQAIALVLPNSPTRIEGHTDNVPIRSAAYASNWELSTARACTIARFLLDHSSTNPAQLSVAGYAEFHPIAPNTTPTGRARNRRVDIVFLQNQEARNEIRESTASRISNLESSSSPHPSP